jgi:hypothetical protein
MCTLASGDLVFPYIGSVGMYGKFSDVGKPRHTGGFRGISNMWTFPYMAFLKPYVPQSTKLYSMSENLVIPNDVVV